MKKLLSLFAVLSLGVAVLASPADAARSKLRTVNPNWGTWTPQGFVASTDTTFFTGGTGGAGVSDTTGLISTADWDWSPFPNAADPNGTFLSTFKVFLGGSVISADTIRFEMQFSMTPDFSTYYTGSVSGLLVQIGAGGGVQQLFASPVNLRAIQRGGITAYSSTAANGAPAPFPWARIIFTSDGLSTSRISAAKAHVSYWHTDGADQHAARWEWERLRFGTYGPNGIVAGSEKDTSSVRFSAPDTTVMFDMSKALVGPSDFASSLSGDTTAAAAFLLVHLSSDPSTLDSLYICADGSPTGYRWNVTPLANPAGGFMAAVVEALAGEGGLPGALIGIPAHVVTALSAGPGAVPGTPFVRFRVYAGNGGEVAGGVKVWLGYRKNNYSD